MAMQGRLGTMVRWGRRLGSVEVVLYFGYSIYGLHGVWNSSECMKCHLGVSELSWKYRLLYPKPWLLLCMI